MNRPSRSRVARWAAALACATLLVAQLSAEARAQCADAETFVFEASVDFVDSALTSAFSIGSPISGHYSFDPAEPDVMPDEAWIGAYDYCDYAFDIAGYAATVGFGRILVADEGESTVDIYRVQNVRTEPDPVTGPPVNGLVPVEVSLQLTDYSATAIESDELPLEPPALSDFDLRLFRVTFAEPGNEAVGPFFDVRGTLTSLEVERAVAVPFIGPWGRWVIGLLMAAVGYGLLHLSVWGGRRPPAHA